MDDDRKYEFSNREGVGLKYYNYNYGITEEFLKELTDLVLGTHRVCHMVLELIEKDHHMEILVGTFYIGNSAYHYDCSIRIPYSCLSMKVDDLADMLDELRLVG